MRINYTTSYMRPIMGDELDDTLRDFRRTLEEADVQVDTVVGRGLSGAMIVPVLARYLGCDFLVVRKRGDGTHAGSRMEGALGERWAFVDDFYSTGETFKETWKAIEGQLDSPYSWRDDEKNMRRKLRFVGGLFYYQVHFESPEEMEAGISGLTRLPSWAMRTGRRVDQPAAASEAGWSLPMGLARTPEEETVGTSLLPPQW